MGTADYLDVLNPADERVIGRTPVAETGLNLTPPSLRCGRGFKVWSRMSRDRGQIMLKAAALMRERVDEIACSITLEQGKPVSEARLEVIRQGCEFFRVGRG